MPPADAVAPPVRSHDVAATHWRPKEKPSLGAALGLP